MTTGSSGTNYGGQLPAWNPGDPLAAARLTRMQAVPTNLQGPSGQFRSNVLFEANEDFTADGNAETGTATRVILASSSPTSYVPQDGGEERVTDTLNSGITSGTRFYAVFNQQSGRWEVLTAATASDGLVGGGCDECSCCDETVTTPDAIIVHGGLSVCCPGSRDTGVLRDSGSGIWDSEDAAPCSGTDATDAGWRLDTNTAPATLTYSTSLGDVVYEGPLSYDVACSARFTLSSAPCRVTPCVCVSPICTDTSFVFPDSYAECCNNNYTCSRVQLPWSLDMSQFAGLTWFGGLPVWDDCAGLPITLSTVKWRLASNPCNNFFKSELIIDQIATPDTGCGTSCEYILQRLEHSVNPCSGYQYLFLPIQLRSPQSPDAVCQRDYGTISYQALPACEGPATLTLGGVVPGADGTIDLGSVPATITLT